MTDESRQNIRAVESNQGNPAAGKPKKNVNTAPLLLEVAYNIFMLLVVIVAVVVGLLSYRAGCAVWMIALRSGLAVFILGGFLWLVAWYISRGFLEATLLDTYEEAQKQIGSDSIKV
ncbi:MAG TPA: hypothetical protein VIO61_15350 [Anaerolineaceae bacterium]